MNKGMFGFPDKRRYKNFYGFPRKRMLKPVGRNFPKSNEDYDFQIDPTVLPLTVTLGLNSFAGTNVVVDWGDGTSNTTVTGNGTSCGVDSLGNLTRNTINVTHIYVVSGKYNLSILSGGENVISIYLYMANTSSLVGTIKESFALRFPNLELLQLPDNHTRFASGYPFPDNFFNLNLIALDLRGTSSNYLFTGSFPDVSNWTKFKYCVCQYLGITFLPSFNNCVELVWFNFAFADRINLQELPSFSNCTELYYFNISKAPNDNFGFSGTMPSFEFNTQLRVFSCQYQPFSGDQPSFNTCTLIQTLNLGTYRTYFDNDLPSLSNCIELTYLLLGNNSASSLSYTTSLMFDLSTLININSFQVSRVNTTWTNPTLYGTMSGAFIGRNSPNFSGTVTASGTVTNFWWESTGITNVDFTNLTITQGVLATNTVLDITWPLGTKIFIGNNGITTNATFTITSSGISLTNLNATIDNCYTYRALFNAVAKTFLCAGTNPAPSGIYQAPTGYIQATTGISGNDGTPASAKEQIYVLVNQNVNSTTTKKYNWAFTTN